MKLRENLYDGVEAPRADLDAWLVHHNTGRPHLGYRDMGDDPSKPPCHSSAKKVKGTYQRLPRPFAGLELAHGDGRFPPLFRTQVAADLLLPDDWSPGRLTAGQRRDLMEIVEDRHGQGSILITGQSPVAAKHDIIDEPAFADAVRDRSVLSAYRLELDGHSMRQSSQSAWPLTAITEPDIQKLACATTILG